MGFRTTDGDFSAQSKGGQSKDSRSWNEEILLEPEFETSLDQQLFGVCRMDLDPSCHVVESDSWHTS